MATLALDDTPAESLETPTATLSEARRILRLGEAVRLMGLKDEAHDRRSDRTIRNALIAAVSPGWKAPGYRAAIAEWCFYEDDFESWR